MDPSPVRLLLSSSLHGGLLKVVALLCRVAFLFLAVPILQAGELSVYVYVNSLSIILATIAILGLNEELPRQIGGDCLKASAYLVWAPFLSISSILLLAITLQLQEMWSAVFLFTCTLVASRFLGGITRSVNIKLYDFPIF